MDDKKVLIVLPNKDFADEEFQDIKIFFETEAIEVKIINTTGVTSEGSAGFKVNPDLSILQIVPDDYNAIIFVGGSGVKEYSFEQSIIDLVKFAYNLKITLGAIGKAPIIFCNAGILTGKNSTGSESVKNYFKKCGAIYTGKGVEVSGRIVTALGSSDIKEFGNEIVKLIEEK